MATIAEQNCGVDGRGWSENHASAVTNAYINAFLMFLSVIHPFLTKTALEVFRCRVRTVLQTKFHARNNATTLTLRLLLLSLSNKMLKPKLTITVSDLNARPCRSTPMDTRTSTLNHPLCAIPTNGTRVCHLQFCHSCFTDVAFPCFSLLCCT